MATNSQLERRIAALPLGADEDSVSAAYQDGILRVTVALPGPAMPQPKRIPIERDGTPSE